MTKVDDIRRLRTARYSQSALSSEEPKPAPPRPLAPAFRDTAAFTDEDAREMREWIDVHEATEATAKKKAPYRAPASADQRHVLVRDVPRATMDALAAFAREDGRTTNGLIVLVLKRYVEKRLARQAKPAD